MALQVLIAVVGTRENRCPKNCPCNGRAHKNEDQRQNLSQHTNCPQCHIFCFTKYFVLQSIQISKTNQPDKSMIIRSTGFAATVGVTTEGGGIWRFKLDLDNDSAHQLPQKFLLVHAVLEGFAPVDKHHWDFVIKLPPQVGVAIYIHFLPRKPAPARKLVQAFLHHFTQVTTLA